MHRANAPPPECMLSPSVPILLCMGEGGEAGRVPQPWVGHPVRYKAQNYIQDWYCAIFFVFEPPASGVGTFFLSKLGLILPSTLRHDLKKQATWQKLKHLL